jgi:hypothetical protein
LKGDQHKRLHNVKNVNCNSFTKVPTFANYYADGYAHCHGNLGANGSLIGFYDCSEVGDEVKIQKDKKQTPD